MEFRIGLFYGSIVSSAIWVCIATAIVQLEVKPAAHQEQFKQDCISMAHGTVLNGSPRVCRKGNTILFTAK